MTQLSSKSSPLHEEPDYVFFGGAFDPPHLGHIDAVDLVQRRFPNAKVVVVPSFEPPVSRQQQKLTHASFWDRLAMCALAYDEHPFVNVSSIEETLEVPSYTARTLAALKAEYPLSKLAWMIGSDQLSAFVNWYQPKDILEQASLVVLPRPAQVNINLLEMAASTATSLGFKVSVSEKEGVVFLDGGNSIFVLKDAPRDVSSTDIRRLIHRRENFTELDLPLSVRDYLQESELYLRD